VRLAAVAERQGRCRAGGDQDRDQRTDKETARVAWPRRVPFVAEPRCGVVVGEQVVSLMDPARAWLVRWRSDNRRARFTVVADRLVWLLAALAKGDDRSDQLFGVPSGVARRSQRASRHFTTLLQTQSLATITICRY
jgi:hypothetical protein